jgi:hypothetical protein
MAKDGRNRPTGRHGGEKIRIRTFRKEISVHLEGFFVFRNSYIEIKHFDLYLPEID